MKKFEHEDEIILCSECGLEVEYGESRYQNDGKFWCNEEVPCNLKGVIFLLPFTLEYRKSQHMKAIRKMEKQLKDFRESLI